MKPRAESQVHVRQLMTFALLALVFAVGFLDGMKQGVDDVRRKDLEGTPAASFMLAPQGARVDLSWFLQPC